MQLERIKGNSFLYFAVAAVLAVFLFLVIRNSGLYPSIMGDEYRYSMSSRQMPFSEAPVPGYLYFEIYRITNFCGNGFLNAARILNSLFFVSTGGLIFLVARRFCGSKTALFVALLSIVAPINIYTAFFMPEALYFFTFWLATLYLLSLDETSSTWNWAGVGLLIACASLIKPHALFFIPPFAVYILFMSRPVGWMPGFRRVAVFTAVLLAAKLALGYLFAKKAGITLFGTVYTSVATSQGLSLSHYAALIRPSGFVLEGHILTNCLLFGMPLVAAFYVSVLTVRSKSSLTPFQKLSLYTTLILVTYWVIISTFTASIVDSIYEVITRLHLRYYNFAFPLLLIVAASCFSQQFKTEKNEVRFALAALVGAFILYITTVRLGPYTPNIIDCPELSGLKMNSTAFWISGVLSLLAVVLWAFRPKLGAKFYVCVSAPILIVTASFFASTGLMGRNRPDAFDKAGMFAKQYLPKGDLSKIVVVGSDASSVQRSLFQIDNSHAQYIVIPEKESYDLSKVDPQTNWVLVIGDHEIKGKPQYEMALGEFRLLKTGSGNTIEFKKNSWPGIVSQFSGLYPVEKSGRWSCGNTVKLEFVSPLPEKFKLRLVVSPFGPNADKEIPVHVGNSTQSFVLKGGSQSYVLEFENPEKSNAIQIEIPVPCSPKQLGVSNDMRNLGIMFSKLSIEPM